jgi:hypothetical protein
MVMMYIRKVKKESKLSTGFPTLNMRLPSLCMQALGLGYSTVLANRAGGQSTKQDLVKTNPQGATAFPVKRKTLLNLLYSISLNLIIQGCVPRTIIIGAWNAPYMIIVAPK